MKGKYLHLRYDGDLIVDKHGNVHGMKVYATPRLAEIKSMSPEELYEMRACVLYDQYDKIPQRFNRLLEHIAYLEQKLAHFSPQP